MPQMNDFEHIARRQGGLNKHLTAGQMSMLAIGGAIGTGLFLGSAYAIQMAGPAVLLSYLIGGVIALLLMGSLAEMTSEHPTPGSFGDYAEFYLGPLFGFLVRYSYWSCVVLAVGTEVTAIGMYMQFWFPATPTQPVGAAVLGGGDRRQCDRREVVRPGGIRAVHRQSDGDRGVHSDRSRHAGVLGQPGLRPAQP